MNLIDILLFIIIVLVILDAWSTIEVLEDGGIELNRIEAFLISKIGVVAAMLLTHVAYIGILVYLWTESYLTTVSYAVYGLIVVLIAFLYAVVNNLIVMRKLKLI